jgi:hypothetical protein
LLLGCSTATPFEGPFEGAPRYEAPPAALETEESVQEITAEPAAPEPPAEEAPAPVDDRPRARRQWDHVVAAGDGECRAKLEATGAKFLSMKDVGSPNAKGCGIPRGVVLKRGPTGIQYSPPISIDCSLALRLVDIETIIQEEAEAILGEPIVRATTLGSYSCRKVIGRLAGWSDGISEHSFGNAFDLASLQPKKGAAATLLRHYEPDADEPKTKQGVFLRNVQRRIRRELRLRALGPDFDASHRDHFHFDAGSPRWR